jgi:hypothetical protein
VLVQEEDPEKLSQIVQDSGNFLLKSNPDFRVVAQ